MRFFRLPLLLLLLLPLLVAFPEEVACTVKLLLPVRTKCASLGVGSASLSASDALRSNGEDEPDATKGGVGRSLELDSTVEGIGESIEGAIVLIFKLDILPLLPSLPALSPTLRPTHACAVSVARCMDCLDTLSLSLSADALRMRCECVGVKEKGKWTAVWL